MVFIDWSKFFSFIMIGIPVALFSSIDTDANRATGAESGASLEGLSVADIVRRTGFLTEEHQVTTNGGRKLKLIRIMNPKIEAEKRRGLANKRPIMFIHGEYITASIYVVNSRYIEPLDLSQQNLSDPQVVAKLKNTPIVKSMPLFASAMGHDVWLLNRRLTSESIGLTNETLAKIIIGQSETKLGTNSRSSHCLNNDPEEGSYDEFDDLRTIFDDFQKQFDSQLYSYSLDEQASDDLPSSMAHVLQVTKSDKMALVGHSSGSALIMMMLATKPEWANKVSSSIHLAPSINQTSARFSTKLNSVAILQLLTDHSVPYGKRVYTNQTLCLITRACYNTIGKKECQYEGPEQMPGQIGNNPDAMAAYNIRSGEAVGSRQNAQLATSLAKKGMHYYDYDSIFRNLIAYGRPESPLYPLDRITSKTISIWFGKDDGTVGYDSVQAIVKAIKVPVKVTYIDDKELFFAHNSVILHEKVGEYVNLPAMAEIESQ